MTSSEMDRSIPFITEPDDEHPPRRTRHYSFSPSLHPSPDHSRSPSFREDRHLLGHKFMSTSLEDLRRASISSISLYQCRIHRKSSSKRSRRSQLGEGDSRRYIHRNQSVRSYSRSPRHSYVGDFESPIRRSSQSRQSQRRKSSFGTKQYKQPVVVELTEEQKLKENRRRKIVYIVVGTTLFLLLCAVLAVVVTLTHQSEVSIENKTTIYYTFSPHPKVIHGDFLGRHGRLFFFH